VTADKFIKLVALLRNRYSAATLAKHRVAAAVEHLEAIRFCAPRTLIDIGANKGQFSTAVRSLFPDARIHAFEPLPEAIARFRAVFEGDQTVMLHEVAIGAEAGEAIFHVADRSDSSSLLEPGSGQRQAYGVSAQRRITVRVQPFREALDLSELPHPILMKIDVQGAELEVLQSIDDLSSIDFIYVEVSFIELYETQPLFREILTHLEDRGFRLRGAFNQSCTKAFGPTQVDCLFERGSASA
jgi:FkbM family methyltransferase